MLERILIPLDGSWGSESIVHTLFPVFCRARSNVLLLHVQDAREGHLRGLRGEAVYARSYLHSLSQRLVQRGVAARPLVRTGHAAQTTLDVARHEGASLIAIANRGYRSPADSTLGPVAREILLSSPLPVVALRAAPERPIEEGRDLVGQTYNRILLPLPGVGSHGSVLTLAREVARALGAKLDLLQVVDPESPGGPSRHEELRKEPQESMEGLARTAQEFERGGIRAAAMVAHGPPVEAILTRAGADSRTVVLLGTPERREIRKLLLGRITARVLHEAAVPVFVFSPGGVSAGEEEKTRHAG